MTKYREILRLTALGLSLRNIEKSLHVSQHTIIKAQRKARELSLFWPLDGNLTEAELCKLMFPKEATKQRTKRLPDFNHIRRELMRNGVNKKLLWTEYLEECRRSGDDPLMYFQFCYYIQQDLLILDDFLLHTITDEREIKVLFEVMEKRSELSRCTIVCSQREPNSWASMILNDEVSANAILKRATKHYTVVIQPRN